MNIKATMLIIFAIFCISVFGFTGSIFAAGSISTGQFGGRIVTTQTPPITCTAQYGPIVVSPAKGSTIPGMFVITATNKTVNPGGQILGLYERAPDTQSCFIQAGPYRIPIPTYKIKTNKFNTSRY